MKPTIIFETDQDLASLIGKFKGCSMATVETTTVPKMTVYSRKDATPFYRLYKGKVLCTSTRYVSLGNNYETSVNNRLSKEEHPGAGVFEAESLPWGEWLPGSRVLIAHKGTLYIRLSYLNANGQYEQRRYHYEDGRDLTEEEIARLPEFLPLPKKDSGRQGTEDAVKVITTKLSGITRMTVDGKKYVRLGFLKPEEKEALVA